MRTSRFTFLVLLVVILLASVAVPQVLNQEETAMWQAICIYNLDSHPDPDFWLEGEKMQIPPVYGGGYVVVNKNLAQNPTRVTFYLNRGLIQRYRVSTTTAHGDSLVMNKPDRRSLVERFTDLENRFWHSATWQRIAEMVVLLVLMASLCYLLYWLHSQYRQRQSEESQPDVDQPPFIEPERVPDFNTATQEQTASAVSEAIGRVYGPITIIGQVERGRLNGEFAAFYANGNRGTENYSNEQGFRARVRLENGTEVTAYGRWQCFNLVRGAIGVDSSKVTFTPENSDRHYVVKSVSEEEANAISDMIRTNTETAETAAATKTTGKPEPADKTEAEPDTTTAPTTPDRPIHVTAMDFSRGRVSFTMDGHLTVEEFNSILDRIEKQQGK